MPAPRMRIGGWIAVEDMVFDLLVGDGTERLERFLRLT